MGNQKLKWTQEEEEALIAGIEKYGAGKWKNILVDPQFAPLLTSRSNIDLKVLFFLGLFHFCFFLFFSEYANLLSKLRASIKIIPKFYELVNISPKL